ncbi:uncharacterized protein LOC144048784 [Vanacampus margaritifer]
MTPHVFLGLVVILVGCCTVSHGETLPTCCLSASGKEMPRRAPLVDYHRQVAGCGCRIDAIVFVCRGGVNLCMATDAPRVRQAMRRVDRLKKFCQKKDYKDKRCLGVGREWRRRSQQRRK